MRHIAISISTSISILAIALLGACSGKTENKEASKGPSADEIAKVVLPTMPPPPSVRGEPGQAAAVPAPAPAPTKSSAVRLDRPDPAVTPASFQQQALFTRGEMAALFYAISGQPVNADKEAAPSVQNMSDVFRKKDATRRSRPAPRRSAPTRSCATG
jgi:hypothetical protein